MEATTVLIRNITQSPDDHAFDIRRRDSGHGAGYVAALLQESMGDIVAVASASLVGMRRGHAVAPVVMDASG
jgi:hypothetical protein